MNNTDMNYKAFEASYLALHRSGELKKRGERLFEIMEECELCPRMCRAQRLKGERGFCGAGSDLEIASFQQHFGEEAPLVGDAGSGTIFMTNCSLKCVFCINSEISHKASGNIVSIDKLSEIMLLLQAKGCMNINIVSPSHYAPYILAALDIAASRGLRVPLVYNSCGWERLEILDLLNGLVDIYLSDFKFYDNEMSVKYASEAADYPEITKRALLEMHNQVGVAKPAEDGKIYRGLMIRHLVMPNNVSGTKEILNWIANNLPKDSYINIMSQYSPVYKAYNYPEISRRIKAEEYAAAVNYAKSLNLTNLELQGFYN